MKSFYFWRVKVFFEKCLNKIGFILILIDFKLGWFIVGLWYDVLIRVEYFKMFEIFFFSRFRNDCFFVLR